MNDKLLTKEEVIKYNKLHYDLIQRYQEGERELGNKIKEIQYLLKKDEYNKMSERDKTAYNKRKDWSKSVDDLEEKLEEVLQKVKQKPARQKRNRSSFDMEL